MDDVKGKFKGLIGKVNNPFSSSSSGKFKGQGRVLGSSPNPPSPHPHRPAPPRSSSHLDPRRRVPTANGVDPSPPSASSSKKGANLEGPFECPVCGKAFPLEEEVLDHVELCLESPQKGGGKSAITTEEAVGFFLSGAPPLGSVEVVVRLLSNVAREPENAKFRRVRMGNPKIKEAVGDVKGALGVLECAGFVLSEEEDGEVWATMGVPLEEQQRRIREVVDLLERRKEGNGNKVAPVESNGSRESTGKVKETDRQIRVFFPVPGTVVEQIELPDSFYNLSAQELKKEVELRKKKIADSQLLIPKSYKEKQMKAVRKKYKSTLIRIQFPDGVVLQGVFLPWELTSTLYEFVSSALKQPAFEFDLLQPAVQKARVIPHSSRPGCKLPTLEEEELVPLALLKFRPQETDSGPFTGLCSELLEVSEPLTAASSTSSTHSRLS